MTLTSWFPAFDDCESWTVVSRKKKKSSSLKKQEAKFLWVASWFGTLPFSSVLSRSWLCFQRVRFRSFLCLFLEVCLALFLESQLDILNDPAVKWLEAVLSVRDRGPSCPVPACPRVNAGSCVAPLSRRHSGYGNEGENQLDRVARVSAGSRAPPVRCPNGRVSVAVPGEHFQGSDAGSETLPARCLPDLVTVSFFGENSRRSDGAAAGSSTGTIGLLEGMESDASKNLANVKAS